MAIDLLIDCMTDINGNRSRYWSPDSGALLPGSYGSTPFKWNAAAGYQHVPFTGLYHVGAREYDPRTARWLQRDPIGQSSGDPNLYRYCGNDAVNLSDPSGCWPTLNRRALLWIVESLIVDALPPAYHRVFSDPLVVIKDNIQETQFVAGSFFAVWSGLGLKRMNAHLRATYRTIAWKRTIDWYASKAGNHCEWDYKRYKPPGLSESYRAYEDMGNINYGATSRALGLPLELCLRIAGLKQIESGTSRVDWGRPGTIKDALATFGGHDPNPGKPPYGDDPRDQYWVTLGWVLAELLSGR